MGGTTAVAHGGNPQDRAASPRPRCIATDELIHSYRISQQLLESNHILTHPSS
ncbi:hypothetical protein [Moorena sp. SIO3B2]|uniref:hypothetical protein n=1 Tax=Moorena sp. SIO3B2 TaxID=2607827 RepID=UPI0002F863BF|nr:hypothetical protein [Moorena sp. SIO3B2]NEP34696.1 hypothetical protein [Moorena sp. SIO3B2]NEQ16972.1 hypothetical protein [Moorena sp. SIO3E2]NES43706.1 hypothetical protein [Moorena sp. SIO2C4]